MGIVGEYDRVRAKYPAGELDLITDVPGVSVGHCTIQDGGVQTGVTAVIPHAGNCFREKCVAATHVINGFGKSAGLMQIDELGTHETPILLTNTMSVGTVSTALIRYMLAGNPDIGMTTGSVNPVVLECNDGRLNDIRGMHVTEEHARKALENAEKNAGKVAEAGGAAGRFEEGAVGAGTGMMCYGLKGGIGSASRVVTICSKAGTCHEGEAPEKMTFTVGTLVLTNFGKLPELTVYGDPVGERIAGLQAEVKEAEGQRAAEAGKMQREIGSIIVVIATNAPLSSRQLGRVARRAQNGIARTGSVTAGGSGEVVVSFSTANKISHYPNEAGQAFCTAKYLREDYLDDIFAAVTESVEESIISSMLHAEIDPAVEGKVHSLREYI